MGWSAKSHTVVKIPYTIRQPNTGGIGFPSGLRRDMLMRRITPVAVLAATGLVLGTSVAYATPGAGPAPAGTSVKPVAATYTPSIADTTTGMTVRQLVLCGGTMYAVGKFTSIKQVKPAAATLARNNVFSFSSTTGQVSSFNPDVNGKVNSIALSPNCSTAYLGGVFTSVGGVTVKNIAAVNTSTGAVVTTFAHNAGGQVNALLVSGSHLLAGSYSTVNGSTNRFLSSHSLTTGRDDGYVHLGISGNYVYTQQDGRASGSNSTQVYNFSLSPDQTRLLAMGVFTSVGGQARRQIFMLDLGTVTTTVDPWYSAEFNQNCNYNEAFWLQDASWSTDGRTVYPVTTGYKPATDNDPASGVTTGFYTSEPRGGLCDAAAAFSTATTANTPVPNHLWVNYAGCDSLYATAADATAVYVGGHQRRLNAPNDCDENNLSSGPVAAAGIGGLRPSDGNVYTTAADPYTGEYQRSRGTGADDMVLVPGQGLWIGSDNGSSSAFSQSCGGKAGHAGICLLPY